MIYRYDKAKTTMKAGEYAIIRAIWIIFIKNYLYKKGKFLNENKNTVLLFGRRINNKIMISTHAK
jgi:hypothetical protein